MSRLLATTPSPRLSLPAAQLLQGIAHARDLLRVLAARRLLEKTFVVLDGFLTVPGLLTEKSEVEEGTRLVGVDLDRLFKVTARSVGIALLDCHQAEAIIGGGV